MGQGHILDASTFALWRCDEMPTADTLQAPDSSGNNRNAAAASLAEAGQLRPLGPAGQFVRYFDGTDDVFTRAQDAATTALLKTTAFTVQAFIRWESGATRCIFAHASSGESTATNIQFRWLLRTTGTEIMWETGSGGTDVIHTTSVAVVPPIGTWSHVAVVKTATHLRFYIDGAFIEEIAYVGAQPTGGTSNLFRIGDQSPGSLSFRGGMKDLKLSDKTYTDGEIAAEAALLNTTFELPVDANTHALYRLNENSGALIDSGPNAMHLVPATDSLLIHGLEALCADNGKAVYVNATRAVGEVNAASIALNTALKLPFTFECWIVLGVPWTEERGLWVFGDPGSILAVDNFLSVDILANRTFRWWSEYGTDLDDTRTTSYALPHGRHHLAFRKEAEYTFSGNPVYDVDIFVDGVFQETISAVRQYASGASGIFQLGVATSLSFKGQLDDIRISTVARSDAEILESYQRGTGGNLLIPIEEL